MKVKTIEKTMYDKMASWMASIKDDSVKEIIQNNAIVTGGSITSLFLNEDVNDFDIYFKNRESLEAVVKYYNKEIEGKLITSDFKDSHNSNWSQDQIDGYNAAVESCNFEQVKLYLDGMAFKKFKITEDKENLYEVAFASSNALSLTDKVQIIMRFSGDIKDIHSNFDFIHATNYYDLKSRKLITNLEAVTSILTKTLYYSGSKYPITSILRAKKFILRGWKISAGQHFKMMYQISKLDLDNYMILSEQLLGVDSMFFDKLLHLVKSKKIENTINLSYAYLSSAIDSIFEGFNPEE